jgi:1,4-dihydroxy-2-naphthoate octaprenyltransferase
MSTEFITLTKDDPDFESYLLGTFSRTHRALPVETYHAATARERVTFRVLPVQKVGAPAWWIVYFWSSRPELFGLTLGPAMAAWLLHVHELHEWTRWPSWFALIGLYFLHTAVFLLNDVQDHLRGFDRLNHKRGSRVIQKGWVTARAMNRWAWVNAGLALLFSIPAFLNVPAGMAFVCVMAALGLGVVLTKFGARFGLCDLALALLFGPLLTSGIALASFAEIYPQDRDIGFAFGLLTLWVFQVRQFEDLFRAKAENFRTFLGHLSFDQARKVVIAEGLLLLALQPAVALWVGVPMFMLALTPLVSIPLILTLQRFLKAASPLSSSLVGSSKWALSSHFSWTLWWVLSLGVAWL